MSSTYTFFSLLFTFTFPAMKNINYLTGFLLLSLRAWSLLRVVAFCWLTWEVILELLDERRVRSSSSMTAWLFSSSRQVPLCCCSSSRRFSLRRLLSVENHWGPFMHIGFKAQFFSFLKCQRKKKSSHWYWSPSYINLDPCIYHNNCNSREN